MINLTRVVNSPRFAQAFTVNRYTGTFQRGGYVAAAPTQLPFYGIVQVATDEDINMVPEGDRVAGMMSFISQQEMYLTDSDRPDGTSGLSDRILWNGDMYKIVARRPDVSYGFWKAVGGRMKAS